MLDEYSRKNNIRDKDTLKFEKFVSYSLLSNDFYDSFESDKVGTGDCVGVDTVAIALNDILVYTEAEAQLQTKGQFEAGFTFIQTKTSPTLDLGDYLKFLQTVYIFFSGTKDQQPAELQEAFAIKTHIYTRASRFRIAPTVSLTYVYTGRGLIEDDTFRSQVDTLIDLIRTLPYLFSNVEHKLFGASALADRYKETLNRMTKQLLFQRHVALPKLSTATAAYLGVTRCIDYIEILENQDKKINKGVFYDNVRDYLGSHNPVNADIAETIKSTTQRNLFSVLNNGVTVVAKRVVPSGDTFEISGFQVVNGCQTSHVLFNNREHVTDDMYITVKLIETDDVDLSSSVIKATNSQSVVMKEAFATIKPYHKRLEDFFQAMTHHGYHFHYERRPHQFDDDEEISASDIVSAPLLIKSFVSVVLDEPHKVHFYYGQILRDYNTEKSTVLFSESHHPALYFISHLIAARSRDIAIKNKMGVWSYHIAMLVKNYLSLPLDINNILTDARASEITKRFETGFADAAEEAMKAVRNARLDKNDVMLPEKTKLLIEGFYRAKSSTNKAKSRKYTDQLEAKALNDGSPIMPKVIDAFRDEKDLGMAQGFLSEMPDGIYIVKNIQTAGGADITFEYGRKFFQLRYQGSPPNTEAVPRGRIFVTNRIITKLES